MHGDHGEGGAVGRGVAEHQIVPDLRAQRHPGVLPGLGAVRRSGGQQRALERAGQRADEHATGRDASAPPIRGGLGAAKGAVLGTAHDEAGGALLLQQGDAEAGIEHQRVVCGTLGHRRTHQEAFVCAGARVRWIGAHPRQRQGQALAPDAAHASDEPHQDRRQRAARLRVIMARRTGLQLGPPEPRHIDADRVIAAVGMRLPASLRLHQCPPPRQQVLAGPVPLPQGRPRPPHRSVRQPTRTQTGDHCSPRFE